MEEQQSNEEINKQPPYQILFDPTLPTSLASVCSETFCRKLKQSADSIPSAHDLLGDEKTLLKHLRDKHKYTVTTTDLRVRMCFWLEYEKALLENRKMDMHAVHGLLYAHPDLFTRLFLEHAPRSVFLLCRPVQYETAVSEMLVHGLNRMRDILNLPVVNEKGKVDHRLIAIQLRITAMMDMRKHGAPTQKIQQLNLNLSKELKPGEDVKQLTDRADIVTIQKRLHDIEVEKRRLQGPPQTNEPEVLDAVIVRGKEAT